MVWVTLTPDSSLGTTDFCGASVVTAVANNTACPRRVYTNTPDGRLIVVNADTGERCKDFGVERER